jgi:DNA polymerase-3 subunit delta
MALNQLLDKLKGKDYTGVYLFAGDEEYTKDYYIKKIRDFCIGGNPPDMLRTVFSKSDISPEALYDAVFTPPFIGEKKIIEINDFPLSQPSGVLNRYVNILAGIPSGISVVFIYRSGDFDTKSMAGKPDGKNEFLDFISTGGIFVDFAPEKGEKLVTWVKRHFKAESAEIEDNAAVFLTEYCGNDMYVLAGEINKLCLVYTGKPITSADIENICSPNAEYRLFDVVNCLAEGNATKIKKIYDGLVFTKIKPELILGTISSYFTDLLAFRTALAEGKSERDIKARLGYADFQARRLASACRGVDIKFITDGLRECRETDRAIKSYSTNPYTAIELMLYRILSNGKRKA